MKKFKKLPLLLCILALLFSNASIGFAQDEQATARQEFQIFLPLAEHGQTDGVSGATVVSQAVSVEEQAAALAFWTHERLAAANAMPLMVQTGPAEAEAATPAEPEVSGPAIYTPPGRAAAGADQVARTVYVTDWTAMQTAFQDETVLEAGLEAEASIEPASVTGSSQIYTSYIANWLSALQTQYPHKWIGRFSATTPGGTSYCTATAISGNNIVTAAHCVYDTPSRNAWYTNKVFTPAYRDGYAPHGTFATTGCTILTAWVNLSGLYTINGWAKYDIAVCTVGRNSAGQTLNSAVGYAGRSWGYDYNRHVVNLGYPWKNYAGSWLSWPGAFLRLCSAETFYRTTDTRGMGCNWGGGISGGPWVDNPSLASPTIYGTNGYWPGRASGYVTGVNSGIDGSTQNIFAPRFTSGNIVPLCTARGC